MPEAPGAPDASVPSGSFESLAAEALKAIGKTLGQMSLYRIGHPAVRATLEESQRRLGQVLGVSSGGEVAYTIDGAKLIANGRVIGAAAVVPPAITSLFNRYHLNSIAFKAGLSDAELTALCELAGMRADQAKGIEAAAYLAQRGVTHIGLNEAIYAKVEKAAEGPAPAVVGAAAAAGGKDGEGGPGPGGAPGAAGPALSEKVSGLSIEQSIDVLVRASVADPKEQAALCQTVLRQLQADVEMKVRAATETLRREKTQVENEQVRTQAVMANMAEGVVVVDDQGKVLMMNPAAEELYGVKLGEVAGTPLAQHVREEHLLTLSSEFNVPQDRPIEGAVEVLSTDDTRRTVRASAAVVQNEAGKPVGMVSVLTDVTKHKEIDKMEREFVAHVTHELRAPLSSIRAALEILTGDLSGKLGEEEERIFRTALKNTDRLDDLIRGILDFSKIESGQMTVHPRPVDADRPAREGADGLRPWCQKKGINLEVSSDSGLPQVEADFSRTVQVVVNLLSNAIKFTPSGGRITVRAQNGTGKFQKFVVYSVADTGPGIAKEDHGKIFEKFVQIAAGEKHVGGTGLGLAIAKALVHLQNGQMWLESELGSGATFYFTLPVYVNREPSQPAKAAPVRAPWWRKLLGMK